MKALAALEPWLKQGASSDLKNPGAELATGISTFFRYVTTPLAQKYGGGESGLARFLKDSTARINADPKAPFSDEETKFLDSVLLAAWEQSSGSGRETGRSRSATANPNRLGWFDSLDGFGSWIRRSTTARRRSPRRPDNPLARRAVVLNGCFARRGFRSKHCRSDAATGGGRYRTSTMKLWGEAKCIRLPCRGRGKLVAERRSPGDDSAPQHFTVLRFFRSTASLNLANVIGANGIDFEEQFL